MANLQLFDNNAESTLDGAITNVQTTISVQTGDGALWQLVASPNFSMATIEEEGVGIEVVRITAHDPGGGSPDDFTVVRGQEGTTGLAFSDGAIFQMRDTKETLGRMLQIDPGGDAKGVDSLTIQPGRSGSGSVASGFQAIAIGHDSEASYQHTVAIGSGARAQYDNDVAIGRSAVSNSGGYAGVAIGYSSSVTGSGGIAIGNATAYGNDAINIGRYGSSGDDSVGIGRSANALGTDMVAIGIYSETTFGDTQSVAVGERCRARGSRVTAVGARHTNAAQDFNDSTHIGAFIYNSGNGSVVCVGEGISMYEGSGSSSNGSILIGRNASSQGYQRNIVVGYNASVSTGGEYAQNFIVIGHSASASSAGLSGYARSIIIGDGGSVAREDNVGLGRAVTVDTGSENIAIGANSNARGNRNTILGADSQANPTSTEKIQIGHQASALDRTCNISAAIMNKADQGEPQADQFRKFAGVEVVLLSQEYELTDSTPFNDGANQYHDVISIPTGARFYPEQVGFLGTNISGVTTAPYVSLGAGGEGKELLNNQQLTNLTGPEIKVLYNSADQRTGRGTLSAYMETAATATNFQARIVWRGCLIGY